MLDRIFAAISMGGLVLFMGIVAWFVREPDLLIVIFVVLWIGILYFWRDLKAGGSHVEDEGRH